MTQGKQCELGAQVGSLAGVLSAWMVQQTGVGLPILPDCWSLPSARCPGLPVSWVGCAGQVRRRLALAVGRQEVGGLPALAAICGKSSSSA